MALVQTVNPIPGVKDVFTLLEFLQNPERVQQYIVQIETVRGEINALVEAYGDVKAIDSLKIQAQDDRQAAAEHLAQAKKTADETEKRAQAKMIEANTQSNAMFEEAKAFKVKFDRDAAALTEALNARESGLNAREQVLANREREASALMQKAQALEDKFSKATHRLREAGVNV